MVKWFSARDADTPVILDLGYLQRLTKHIGQRETQELLADGMLDLTDRLDRLRHFGQEGDVKAVASLAHEIAGAAGHQGLTAMAHAAFDVARLVREKPNTQASDLAALILTWQDPSIEALAEYCSQPIMQEQPDRSKSGKSG